MPVTYGGSATGVAGTTSAVVDLVTWSDVAPTAAAMMILAAAWGNSTATAPSAPTGWTAPANNSYNGGSGSWGSDTGPRGISIFYKIYDPADVSVQVDNNVGTSPVVVARVAWYSKSVGSWLNPVCTGATDTTSGTTWSITGASDIGYVAGDQVMANSAYVPRANTMSSGAVAWTGVTMTGGFTQNMTNAGVGGNGVRLVGIKQTNNNPTGTSSAPPVYTATGSSAIAGAGIMTRLRDGGPVRQQPLVVRQALARAAGF